MTAAGSRPRPTIRGKRHAYHKRTPVYCVASFACLPAVPGRFVGAACMRPANLPPSPLSTGIDAVPGVCRGGIYASRQGCAIAQGCRLVARFPHSVGRGLGPAAHYYFFEFEKSSVRRAKSPALPCEIHAIQTINAPQHHPSPPGFFAKKAGRVLSESLIF